MKLLARWHNWEFGVKILKKYQFELTLKTSNHFFLSQYPSYHARCIFWNYLPSWNLKIVTCSFIIHICMNNRHPSIIPLHLQFFLATICRSTRRPRGPLTASRQTRCAPWVSTPRSAGRPDVNDALGTQYHQSQKQYPFYVVSWIFLQQLQRYDIISRGFSFLYWFKGQNW